MFFQTTPGGKVEVLTGSDGVVICRFETPIKLEDPPCLTKLPIFTIKFKQGSGDAPDMKDVIQVGKAIKVRF